MTRTQLTRLAKRAAIAVLLAAAVVYLGDSVAIRFPGRERFDVVQINKYLAIPLKGGKTEYDFDGTEDVTCVRALFPQLGRSPCWYLRRQQERWQQF